MRHSHSFFDKRNRPTMKRYGRKMKKVNKRQVVVIIRPLCCAARTQPGDFLVLTMFLVVVGCAFASELLKNGL